MTLNNKLYILLRFTKFQSVLEGSLIEHLLSFPHRCLAAYCIEFTVKEIFAVNFLFVVTLEKGKRYSCLHFNLEGHSNAHMRPSPHFKASFTSRNWRLKPLVMAGNPGDELPVQVPDLPRLQNAQRRG
jgi:hypothetical protein